MFTLTLNRHEIDHPQRTNTELKKKIKVSEYSRISSWSSPSSHLSYYFFIQHQLIIDEIKPLLIKIRWLFTIHYLKGSHNALNVVRCGKLGFICTMVIGLSPERAPWCTPENIQHKNHNMISKLTAGQQNKCHKMDSHNLFLARAVSALIGFTR